MSHTEADDGWADLYRELGVESKPPAAKPAHAVSHAAPAPAEAPDEEFGVVEADEPEAGFGAGAFVEEESESAASLEAGDADGDDPGEEAGVVEGEPGDAEPRKKRRRRRRRRRKGDGPEGAEGATAGDAGESGEVGTEGEGEYEDEPGPAETVAAPAARTHHVDEGLAPESGRELIANWNVPSWQEIVAGLYRPDR